MPLTTYNFASFDYVDADIYIPTSTVFFRGIDSMKLYDEIIRPNTPMFIGPLEIAKEYGNVHQVMTTKPLKLIDFRRLRNLMRLVINSRKHTSNEVILNKMMHCIALVSIAFGLVSYKCQIDLIERHVKWIEEFVIDPSQVVFVKKQIEQLKATNPSSKLHPIEPEGVRIAETSIDFQVIKILKELFGEMYDGYIAPKMFSPFHEGYASHEEILLFDPIKSGLSVLTTNKLIKIKQEPIKSILQLSCNEIIIKGEHFERKIYQGGMLKKKSKSQYFDRRHDMFDIYNETSKQYKKATKMAIHFANNTDAIPKPLQSCRHPNLTIDEYLRSKFVGEV